MRAEETTFDGRWRWQRRRQPWPNRERAQNNEPVDGSDPAIDFTDDGRSLPRRIDPTSASAAPTAVAHSAPRRPPRGPVRSGSYPVVGSRVVGCVLVCVCVLSTASLQGRTDYRAPVGFVARKPLTDG